VVIPEGKKNPLSLRSPFYPPQFPFPVFIEFGLCWTGIDFSAAIYGLRGKKDVDVFILHPHKRISPIQEAQMCTVLDANVHNIAVNGTFDDCQDIVKAIFSDETFNKQFHLGAVNSINWARILAQITYYFYSYFSLLRQQNPLNRTAKSFHVQYVVPTGNFGDILAGYYAKKMGLPIEKLVVATNENDILDRFFRSGRYEKKPVFGTEAEGGEEFDGVKAHEEGAKETLSPAMDILVSSNFERLLWYLAYECDGKGSDEEKGAKAGEVVKGWMGDVKGRGGIVVSNAVLEAAKRDFASYRVSDKEVLTNSSSKTPISRADE
jgi:threonine synthase